MLILLIVTGPVQGSDPLYKNYSIKDGLPSQIIYCAIQDNDGYMWFGTDAGVSRFDGQEFKNFTVRDGLTDNDILKIYKDSKGRLWFLTLKGVLCYYYQNKIYNPSNDPNLPTQKAYNGLLSFLEDSNHDLWFGGLGGQLVKVPQKGKAEIFNIDDKELRQGKAGRIFLYQPEKNKITLSGPAGPHTYITTNFEEVENSILTADDSLLIYENTGQYKGILISKKSMIELDGYNKKTIVSAESYPFLRQTARIEYDRNQGVWIFTIDFGTWYFERKNGKLMPPKSYFPGHHISRAYVDKEGNRWFCTLGNGLYKVADNQKWISVLIGGNETRSGYDDNILCAYRAVDNAIWLGSMNSTIYRVLNDQVTRQQIENAKKVDRMVAIAANSKNEIYFLSDNLIFKRSSTVEEEAKIKPLNLNVKGSLKNICFDKQDNMLIATSYGISQIDAGAQGELRDSSLAFVPFQRIYSLCVDHRNRTWFEIFERLYCIDQGVLHSFAEYDTLFTNKITAIAEGVDSTIIIATQNNGVFILKEGKIIASLHNPDVFGDRMCRKLHVDNHRVYVATNDGLAFFDFKDAQVSNIQLLTTNDGILSDDINTVITDDRFIYLASSNGLCRVDKSIVADQAAPPDLKINWIKNREIMLADFNGMNFDHDRFNLSIKFTAITFNQPEQVTYQYRLNDDKQWIDSKNNILQLSDLVPGSYSVSIRAKKFNSGWSPPQTISFAIMPPFWQNINFQLLMIALILVIVYYAIKRITLKKYRMQLLELKARQELDAERNRISSDMHDDLGADISKIAVLSEVIKTDPAVVESIRTNVQKIADYAIDLRKKMDNIVWALNPSNDTVFNFIPYVREAMAELTEQSNITCRVEMKEPCHDMFLHAMLRRNLFLIIKEAVNNAIRHSAATTLVITIGIDKQCLFLEVKDNGKGFDVNERSKRGNGLNNMEKRVAQINGLLSVLSTPGKGTSIHVRCTE